MPYRYGGSSKYLTISFLLVPSLKKKYSKRIVKKLYTKFRIDPNHEIKGADLDEDQRDFLTDEIVKLLTKHTDIQLLSITVKKANVEPHIKADQNKLYNYMIGLALIDEICSENTVTLIPDPRTIKIKSGNSLLDYLQISLWFVKKVKTKLIMQTVHSNQSLNLQLIDMVAHITWCMYEDGRLKHAKKLLPYMKNKELFFS